MNGLQRITRIALLTALSLILFILEGFLPLPLPVPGAKLGLAAIVTLIALYTMSTRVRRGGLHPPRAPRRAAGGGGGLAPMLYSLAGGAASFAAMALLKRCTQFSIVGISAAGGFLHNMAQLLVAAAVLETTALFVYAPVLGIVGILTGILIGIAAQIILQKISG